MIPCLVLATFFFFFFLDGKVSFSRHNEDVNEKKPCAVLTILVFTFIAFFNWGLQFHNTSL